MTQAICAFNYLENCKISGRHVDPLHIKHVSFLFTIFVHARKAHKTLVYAKWQLKLCEQNSK